MRNFIIAIFFLIVFQAFGQFSKGMLRLEVASIKMNGEEAPPEMTSMLGNMQVMVYSNGIVQKNVMSMMMMKNITILDSQKDSVYIYMDMMGKKYLMVDQYSGRTKDSLSQVTINNISVKEYPEDKKEILGYACSRVDITMPITGVDPAQSASLTIKTYIAKELDFDPSFISQNNRTFKLKGTPLEFLMLMGTGSFQLEMQMVAKEFKPSISLEDLNAPQGNYKRYTLDEFQKEFSKFGK